MTKKKFIRCKQCGSKERQDGEWAYLCSTECRELYERARRERFIETAPTNSELVYPEYKEPLRKVEGGHGYLGTVAYTKDMKYIQCHICGKLCKSLSSHLPTHKLTLGEYKDRFRLADSTVLVGNSTQDMLRESYEKSKRYFLKYSNSKEGKKSRERGLRKRAKQNKGSSVSLETRNKNGTCPDQLKEKVTSLHKELGRIPTTRDFKRKYNQRFLGQIYYYFGSWRKFLNILGLEGALDMQELRTSKESILQSLKGFYAEKGRVARYSDFNKLPFSYTSIQKYWKTYNDARMEAGIPIVIETSTGRWAETFEYDKCTIY
jgi:hypothetical protein